MGEIVREFKLISYGNRSGVTEPVPAGLLALVEELGGPRRQDTDAIQTQVEDAARAGRETVDISFPGDEDAVELTERITDLLDSVDEFCRAGDLLTLAAPPQVVAWRHWWRDQVVAQVRDGAEPEAWTPVTQP
jgi:hypothetical protein